MSELQPMPKQSNFRFWCQKVLPLVYDESLSYYELLNKVIAYLNNTIEDVGTCETNIDLLLQAFEQLQEYVNDQIDSLAPVVEEVIDQMVESGQFGDILVDAIADVIAEEYDPTESYVPLNYVLYNGDVYCCTANTTGEFDPTKWRQTTVGDDLNALMVRVYTLKASQVNNDSSVTGTTVKDALNTLKTALGTKAEYLNLGNIPPAEFTTREAQIEEALNRINVYDKPVIFYYTSSGRWSGIALKYTDGHYGYIIASYPNDNATYFGYLVNDVFSVHRFAGSSDDIKNESNVSGTTVTNALNNLNTAINSNPNIKLRSVTNSILTGSVWINEVFDHLVEYNDSPYGQIANALNILKANVTHTMLSGAGLIYDAGNGNFYDYIVTNSINLSGYDYLMTMLWYNDMLSTPIGTPNDTSSSNTLAGKVISILSYLKTRYPSVKLILVGIPPVNGYIYGNDVFTGTYGNGYNIKQCDALMHTLAEKYNFIFLDFEQWFISTYYQNFTDGTNVHSKSDKVYRVMGEYLATALSGQMSSNSDYLKVIKLTSDNISGSFSGWRNMFATDVPIIDETMTVVEIMPADPTQIITIVPAWKVVKGNVQLYCSLKGTGTTFDVTLARTNTAGNSGVFHEPKYVQRSLVTTTTIGTSGAVTVNNYSSRKFSDYSMLILLLGVDGADNSCCMTLPVSRFATNNFKLRMTGLGGANLDTPSGAIITYVSDTSCTVELTGSKQFNKFQIFGITVE